MSLEWLVFVGILSFLTFQIILQTIWKTKEGQEVSDIAMLSKPSPINEEQQPEDEVDGCELNGYAEDKGIESKFRENLCEELDIKEHLNEEVSKEEAKEDRPSSVCLTAERFLTEEVKYKLAYFFRDLSILESQSEVPDEPTAWDYEDSDEAFERITDEEQWEKDENGDVEGEPYNDQDYKDKDSPGCYFPEEHSCKA